VSLAQLSSTDSGGREKENTTIGFVAVLLAACTSGFSGVYFERILKNSATSLWVRNVQMGLSSIMLAIVGIYFSGDGPVVWNKGFFYGYNWVVWTVVLLQAVGGLVVAVVVKYADNILKGFAASFSIVTSCILCYFFLDFRPNSLFLWGSLLVNIAMYLYSYVPKAKEKKGGDEDKGLNALSGVQGSPSHARSNANALSSSRDRDDPFRMPDTTSDTERSFNDMEGGGHVTKQ
jgi:UDP-galactose transporter